MEKLDPIKTYSINVPIYTTIEKSASNGMYEQLTYDELIKSIMNLIDDYNKYENEKITQSSNAKIKETIVDKIIYKKANVGNRPTLLIRITAYETNIIDGYVEIGDKIDLQKDSKIGSDNYVFLLYPEIFGLNPNNYTYRWLILLYDDPNKYNYELTKIVKKVLKSVLHLKPKNIKFKSIIDELHKVGNVPELSIKLKSVHKSDNDVDLLHKSYLSRFRLKKEKDLMYENIPAESTADVIENIDTEDYSIKEVKVVSGTKEYRILTKIDEARRILEETTEEILNEKIVVSEEDIEKLYNDDFIIDKLTDVLNRYAGDQ